MIPKVKEKIEELFTLGSGSFGSVDFKSACKLFWVCMSNSLSIVDFAGIFTVSLPNGGSESLSNEMFMDFFKAFSRVKFPSGIDFCEKLLDELRIAKSLKVGSDLPAFGLMMEKNVIKVLLKYDLPIRKAFSNFCGQSVRVGGVLSWDEVRSMQIGMEIDGFISFAGSYGLIPEHLSTQQCELMFRDVLNRFPVAGNAATMNSSILFPQFQLLLMTVALEKIENNTRKDELKAATEKAPAFAKKVFDSKNKPLSECLFELLRDIGISKIDDPAHSPGKNANTGKLIVPDHLSSTLAEAEKRMENYKPSYGNAHVHNAMTHPVDLEPNLFTGTVVMPQTTRADDMYSSSFNHSRQAMLMRMEHLFDEVESKVLSHLPEDCEILTLLAQQGEETFENKVRLPTKPVVIGDAVPVPARCPENIEQLLEAALAHHNLGSFEDSLKFLEAARIHLTDADHHTRIMAATGEPDRKLMSRDGRPKSQGGQQNAQNAQNALAVMELDVDMYITLCKGNVYQSCGDDEQSLLNYMEGWAKSKQKQDRDWEMIAINSIGMLAYYNLRYDVALLCFNVVATYREQEYGVENVDTASSWNNEACCLFCLQKRGEARVRFEKGWNTISRVIGHRAPRAVTAWKNLEKARRAHAPLRNLKDLTESVAMRPDASRLIPGGNMTIQALAPPEKEKKKKGLKGGGKKKKK